MWQWDVHTVYGMLRPKPDQLITDNSVLIRHGTLTFFSPNTMTHKPRYFFLFDHAFLVTKHTSRAKFQLKVYITLRPELQVITDDRDNQFRINATIKGKGYPIIMFANSRREKEAWVNDIVVAISRLGARNYGLEARALSQEAYKSGLTTEEPVIKKSTPREKERKSARGYDLGWEPDTPSARPSSGRKYDKDVAGPTRQSRDRESRRVSDEESPRHSPNEPATRGGSKRGSQRDVPVKVERKVEREEILEITDPARGKTRRRKTRKVYYDSDEEPHYYTDSDGDEESFSDDSSSSSNSSGGGGPGGRAGYDNAKAARDSGGLREKGGSDRRAGDRDVSRPASGRNAPSKKRITDIDEGDGGGGLRSPPAASSAQRDRRSARLSKVPSGEGQPHTPHKDQQVQGLAYSLDTLSLGLPQQQPQHIFYSQQDQRTVAQHPAQGHQQQQHHLQTQQAQAPQASATRPALGLKVMDLDGLNTADFNKIASRGFNVNQATKKEKQPAPQQVPTQQQHPPVHTLPQQLPPAQPLSQQLPPQALSQQLPHPSLQQQTPQQPLIDPLLMGLQQTSTLQPQMYQQLLLQQQQQQQQYLQQMQQQQQLQQLQQQQQLQQLQQQQHAKLGQPTTQPAVPALPSLQQLQLQQLQQQQLAQLQQQQLMQQQKQPSGGTTPLTPSTPTTPLAYGAPTPQGQPGVIYVDPLTYLQYQQQQQLLQLQQQQLMQQQLLNNQYSPSGVPQLYVPTPTSSHK